jgi:hypothetical protein
MLHRQDQIAQLFMLSTNQASLSSNTSCFGLCKLDHVTQGSNLGYLHLNFVTRLQVHWRLHAKSNT